MVTLMNKSTIDILIEDKQWPPLDKITLDLGQELHKPIAELSGIHSSQYESPNEFVS